MLEKGSCFGIYKWKIVPLKGPLFELQLQIHPGSIMILYHTYFLKFSYRHLP